MKTYQIICPDCQGSNTLMFHLDKHTEYFIEAAPSPNRQSKGTFNMKALGHADHKNRKVVCTSCGWSKNGWPVVSDIVREIPGDA